MSDDVNGIDARIATRIRTLREGRNWSLGDLAEASAVSKAMLSKIERQETSPTAALLGRISAAFSITLSQLLSETEATSGKLIRHAAQQRWRDPETGFQRVALSPPAAHRLQLVEGELPPGARISYPASSYGFFTQQMWVLDGTLIFHEGKTIHVLEKGDCLELSDPADCTFENQSKTRACRYLVAISMK
jgi:transcriptional regulator with XRE-family HTH domain